jgi:hypothetical protein
MWRDTDAELALAPLKELISGSEAYSLNFSSSAVK